MPGIKIEITVPEDGSGSLPEVDKKGMMSLDKGSYPILHIQGDELPFDEEDVGKEVPITGMVRLRSIKYQGYNYMFEMTKVDFPGKIKESDIGSISARKKKRVQRGG